MRTSRNPLPSTKKNIKELVDPEELTSTYLTNMIDEISRDMIHIYDTCNPNLYDSTDIPTGDITPHIHVINILARFAKLCEKKIRILNNQLKGKGKDKYMIINDQHRTLDTLSRIKHCIYLHSFGFKHPRSLDSV